MVNQSNLFPAFIRVESDTTGVRELEAAVSKFGENARTQITGAMSEIDRVISATLSRPRNATGSLDLGTEEVRANAAALQVRATAAREVAEAIKQSGTASRNELAAAQALALSFERQSVEALDYARALDLVQAELNQTQSATQQVIAQTGRGTTAFQANTQSVRAMRQATTQAGQQLQDIVISMGSGQRASTVLAQQLPQLAFAFSDVGGKVGAVARFLSGPWGVAVAIGAFALGPLIDNLFKTEDASDKTGRATDRLANQLDLSKNSYSALTDVVEEYNKSQTKTEALTYAAIIAHEKETEALLKVAEARLAAFTPSRAERLADPEGAASLSIAAGGEQSRIDELRKQLNAAILARSNRSVELQTNPRLALEIKYQSEIIKLEALHKQELAKGNVTLEERNQYERERVGLIKEQQAALEKFDKSQQAGRKKRDRDGITDFINPVDGRVTSNFGKRSSPGGIGSTNHKGVDFKASIGTIVKAPADGVVIESGYIKGFGQAIYIDHGSGTISRLAHLDSRAVSVGENVTQGQAVGRSGNTGNTTGPHLHYEVLRNGRQVNPLNGRFPTSKGDAGFAVKEREIAAAAAREAQQAAAAFANELQTIDGISQRITSEFDEQPKLIDRIANAQRIVAATIEDINLKLKDATLSEEQRNSLIEKRAEIEKAGALASDAVNKIFREDAQRAGEQAALDQLRIEGRLFEATVLEAILQKQRQIGSLTSDQADEVAQILIAERERAVLLEQIERSRAREREIVNETRDNVRSTVREFLDGQGIGSIGNFFSRAFDTYLDALSDEITDGLFGNVEKKQRDRDLGFDKVQEASFDVSEALNATAQSIANFGKAVDKTAAALDPDADIIVNGRPVNAANDNTGPRSAAETIKSVFKDFADEVFGAELSEKIGGAVRDAFQGAAVGQAIDGVFKSVGVNSSRTGGRVGGAVGGAVGSIFGPAGKEIGQVAGAIIGSLVGGAFKKAQRGAVVLDGSGPGTFTGSNKVREALTQTGNSVTSGLTSLAERLGGSVGAFNVSIGKYKDYFRVSGSGSSAVGDKKFPNRAGSDLLYDGKDEEEAIRVAILNAIQDGAIQGIREGAKRLLQAGSDIERAVEKALSFQSVFDRLKEIDDPVGAAIDRIDNEFRNLQSIFQEAGASASEYADLQRLYEYERAKAVEEANRRITASLRSLYDELTVGNDARSLTERRQFAQAAYDPLAARVAAGDKTAYDAYADAARELLDIERQIFGSQAGYVDRLNEVTRLTGTRIEAEENVASMDRLGLTFTTAVESLYPYLEAINANIGGLRASGGANDNGGYSGISYNGQNF